MTTQEELLKKKPRAADEKGICDEWGNWVDIKAKTVKEDNKYKNNKNINPYFSAISSPIFFKAS